MKSNNFITAGISILAMLCTLLGCAKMDDTYSEFVKEGERIYVAKADSLKIRGGKNRLQLSWLLLSDPKVVKYKVTWNNGRDSIVNPVVKTASVDTITLMINNIEEGTHEFEIYTYDKLGNTSVKATKIGRVFGSRYAASLLPATYEQLIRDKNQLKVVWSEPSNDLAALVINYNYNNVMKSIRVDRTEKSTLLQGLQRGGEFEFMTAYLPEPGALDTFYTDYSTIKLRSDTIVNWNNYRAIFGLSSSMILVGDGTTYNPNLHRTVFDASTGFYQEPTQIGGSWNGLVNMCARDEYIIAQLTGSGLAPRRYNYSHSSGSFPGPNPNITGGGGWADTDQFFIFKDDIFVRNKKTGKLIRHYLKADATAVTKSTDIVAAESWNKYDKLIAARSWIFGSTPDGKMWRIPVTDDNKAGAPVQVGTGWNKYSAISLNGNNILARTSAGELWEYPVDETGKLGVPEDIWVTKLVAY